MSSSLNIGPDLSKLDFSNWPIWPAQELSVTPRTQGITVQRRAPGSAVPLIADA